MARNPDVIFIGGGLTADGVVEDEEKKFLDDLQGVDPTEVLAALRRPLLVLLAALVATVNLWELSSQVAAAAGAAWALLGPALMTFLLVRVSGVALLGVSRAQRPAR